LPSQPIRRACPLCLNDPANQAVLLAWKLPLMLSCPLHGCWLESYWGVPGRFLGWENADATPRTASDAIGAMDRRTWQALTMGHVELPRRRIHAGLWFRLLRTLLDELNTPLSQCGTCAGNIRYVWERCGHPLPGLAACLKALRAGDTLIVWKLDRLGRDLRHLINTVHDLTARSVGLKVLTGHGAAVDTTTAAGKLVFGIFAALAEFERELISERTLAGLASARARGRTGGRPFKMTTAKLRLARAAMGQPETKVGDLCEELGITRQTLYRHVSPKGELRPDGLKLLSRG
ncbi:MAG: recombinase family protein, partial [Polaromonas sp.]